MEHPWLLTRCREVQASPNDHLDLWARDHYKSTIITFAHTIFDIIRSHGDEPLEPEESVTCIYSCTRPNAKKFLQHIKREFEDNKWLQALFPDIFYAAPHKEAKKWSDDEGIVVKRKSNRREATVFASGLIDGMPTGAHYNHLVFDDIVTVDLVRSPEVIEKVNESLSIAYNTGTSRGVQIRRMIGTRYAFNDSYKTVLERKSFKPRVHPATKDGTEDGEPVFLAKETLLKKRQDQGPYVFACQQLLNPRADVVKSFKRDWLRFYTSLPPRLNKYILVDPASEKKKVNDWTAMVVWGLGEDENYYLVDLIHDRLSLKERAHRLIELHKKHKPIAVGYEKYGMQSDIEHHKDRMNEQHYRFHIEPLAGHMGNTDRIGRLQPLFELGKIWLPEKMHKTIYDNTEVDLMEVLVETEYMGFPVYHCNIMDAMSRIRDEKFKKFVSFPLGDDEEEQTVAEDDYEVFAYGT